MKHSYEEIIKALTIIKETCESQEDGGCRSCPFGTDREMCKIMNESPNDWNIEGKKVWRALQ